MYRLILYKPTRFSARPIFVAKQAYVARASVPGGDHVSAGGDEQRVRLHELASRLRLRGESARGHAVGASEGALRVLASLLVRPILAVVPVATDILRLPLQPPSCSSTTGRRPAVRLPVADPAAPDALARPRPPTAGEAVAEAAPAPPEGGVPADPRVVGGEGGRCTAVPPPVAGLF